MTQSRLSHGIGAMVFALASFGPAQTALAQGSPKPMIVISRPVDSDDLDYVTQDGNVNIWMFNLTLEGLVKNSDDGKTIEPMLAEKWDISKDMLTYTFHLRKGVKFSDGTPVTGADWVFSLTRARDTKGSPWAFSLEAVKDIKAPNDNTVVITLKKPWVPILADLAMFNGSVTSKAYFEKVGAKGFSQRPIGTGPYSITEWRKGEFIMFDKNPYYWRAGLPKTPKIKVTVVPDDNTRMLQLQAGDVDATTFVPWNRMAEMNGGNLRSEAIPSTETRYVQFNTTKKSLSDVRVRQALDMATDKDALSKLILFGFGQPAKGFMAKAGQYWNADLKTNPLNVAKAKALMTEAGFGNGFETTITLGSGNTVAAAIGTVLKEQWGKIGVKVNLETLEGATAWEKFKKMETDITLRAWTNDMVDASQQVDYTCIYANSKNFSTGWQDPKVEQLAQDAKSQLKDPLRRAMYAQIQEMYQRDMPMITLFHVPYPVAMKKSLKGFVQTPLGNYRFENLQIVK
jgi:peptide/nickel transport system substrate-binding protein